VLDLFFYHFLNEPALFAPLDFLKAGANVKILFPFFQTFSNLFFSFFLTPCDPEDISLITPLKPRRMLIPKNKKTRNRLPENPLYISLFERRSISKAGAKKCPFFESSKPFCKVF